MDQSFKDLEEIRANPDALVLYIMSYFDRSTLANTYYIAFAKCATEAGKHIAEQYGVPYDDLGVHQHFIVNEQTARIVETKYGGVYFKTEKGI